MTIDSIYGTIFVAYKGNITIRQEGSGAEVKVSLEEAETLAKALFGKRNEILKKLSPPIPNPQPKPVIPSPPKKSRTFSSYKAQQMGTHSKAYQQWTEEEEGLLKKYHAQGKGVNEIAELLNRGSGAISARLKKIGLM